MITIKQLFSIHLLILIAGFLSFRYFLERILFPHLGMGWSYVIDQMTPLILTSIALFYFHQKYKFIRSIVQSLKADWIQMLMLFIIAFVSHLGILTYFFWSDEVIWMLHPITNNNATFFFHADHMKGYFITSYALLYLLFGTNAWVFPFISVLTFSISVLFAYWFVYLLSQKRMIAFLAALFFATTPAYLDMFTWHSTAHAPILIFGLTSLIALLYYQQTNKTVFYIFSILFFFVTIKMGFVRSAGLTFIPLFLLCFPLVSVKKKYSGISALLLASPYFAITTYFVLFNFLFPEISIFWRDYKITGSFSEAFTIFLEYREAGKNSIPLLPKLVYFLTHMFVPSGLLYTSIDIIRWILSKTIGETYAMQSSIVLLLGNVISLSLGAILAITLYFRKNKYSLLVIFAIMFIVINMFHSALGFQGVYFRPTYAGYPVSLDNYFIKEDLGYGPGSRYLYISSLGVALLFALGMWLVGKRSRVSKVIAVLLALCILLINTFYTIRAQVINSDRMQSYKYLADHIFQLVPRDGKPKLIYSVNSEKSGLDTKFAGWRWMYGFYRIDEFTYSKDRKEVLDLIQTKKYKPENVYAFYHNPSTLTFFDVSQEVRKEFFTQKDSKKQSIPLKISPSKTELIGENFKQHPLLYQRAVLSAFDINKRIISPKTLHVTVQEKRVAPRFPFADVIILPNDHGMPLPVWQQLNARYRPLLLQSVSGYINATRLNTFKGLPVHQIPITQRTEMQSIILNREQIIRGAIVTTNSINTDNKSVSVDSLIDNHLTHFPFPREDERYYMAASTAAEITIQLTEPRTISRIFLNTMHTHNTLHIPIDGSIFVSLDGITYTKVASISEKTISEWSPNKGIAHAIDLPTVNTQFIKIQITKTKGNPPSFDEIIIDSDIAKLYPMDKIYEIELSSFWHVDTNDYFQTLMQSDKYNHMFIIYACAEDKDWQKQQEHKETDISGIWHINTISPHEDKVSIESEIDCQGSILRQVSIVGPSYPLNLTVESATIE